VIHGGEVPASIGGSRLTQVGSSPPCTIAVDLSSGRSPYGTPRPLSQGCGRPQPFRPGGRSGRDPGVRGTRLNPVPLLRPWKGSHDPRTAPGAATRPGRGCPDRRLGAHSTCCRRTPIWSASAVSCHSGPGPGGRGQGRNRFRGWAAVGRVDLHTAAAGVGGYGVRDETSCGDFDRRSVRVGADEALYRWSPRHSRRAAGAARGERDGGGRDGLGGAAVAAERRADRSRTRDAADVAAAEGAEYESGARPEDGSSMSSS
jgi:hypothetical protein